MTDYSIGFRDYLSSVKKASDNTLESYIRDFLQFIDFCRDISLGVTEADIDIISRYINKLKTSGKSHATLARVVASLRCFYNYLISIGDIMDNPVIGFKLTKEDKKLPEVLTNNEVSLLLSKPAGGDYKSCRDKAMLELLYATGIKVFEMIDLKIYDINLQIGILHIHSSKGDRIVPIYPTAVKTLMHYVSDVRPAIVSNGEEDHLFTNMNGQPLTRQGFWKIVKHYADLAGIEKDITPHTLRHSFAANLLENGAQLKDIKEMLGHSDISSTQVYAQILKNKYAQAYKRFHPMASNK